MFLEYLIHECFVGILHYIIELDDGKFTGKPDQFDGKNHGFL